MMMRERPGPEATGPRRRQEIWSIFSVVGIMAGLALLGACALSQTPGPAPGVAYEQARRTETYRVGTVVAGGGGEVQVALDPPEALTVQDKSVAGQVVQEILDSRRLLSVRISRVYRDAEAKPGEAPQRVDITDRVTVLLAERDRLILKGAPELNLARGHRLYFKVEKIRVAPVDLTTQGLGPSEQAEVLLEDLTTVLASTDQFTVLERAKIKALLKEHELLMRDLLDPKSAPRIGRLLGAEAILTGSVVEADGKTVANIRMVDAEQGVVILAIRKEIQRAQTAPRVVRTIPENGATNVPTTLKEVVIVFDQPMSSPWNIVFTPRVTPDLEATRRSVSWRDDRTIVYRLSWGLKPNTPYSFSINTTPPEVSPGSRFKALGQDKPIPPQRFFFTTGE